MKINKKETFITEDGVEFNSTEEAENYLKLKDAWEQRIAVSDWCCCDELRFEGLGEFVKFLRLFKDDIIGLVK